MKMFVFGGLAVAALAGTASAQLVENFDEPFADWTGRWLYQGSNLGNYYVASGTCDESYRGNNPEGLWIVDTQVCGDFGNIGGPTVTIDIDPALGHTLRSFSFGIEAWSQCDVKVWDMDGNVVGELLGVSGGGYDFDHVDVITALSGNGIGKVTFDSTPYGGGQIEGNTSIDNISADLVPAPGAAGLLGFTGLLLARRRR
jgi:hypothetical protein